MELSGSFNHYPLLFFRLKFYLLVSYQIGFVTKVALKNFFSI